MNYFGKPYSRSLPPTNRTLAHQSCRANGHDSRRKESTAKISGNRRAAASVNCNVPLAGKTRVKPKKRSSSDGSSASRCRLHPFRASRRMSNSPPVDKKKITKRRQVRQPRPRAPNPRDTRPVMARATKTKQPSSGGPSHVTRSRPFHKKGPRPVSLSPVCKMEPLPPREDANTTRSSRIGSTNDSKETKANIDIKTPKEMMATKNQRNSPKPSKQHHTDAVGQSLPNYVKDTKITQEPVSEVVADKNGRKTKPSPFKWFTSLKKRVSKSAIFSALRQGCSSVCCLRSKTLS